MVLFLFYENYSIIFLGDINYSRIRDDEVLNKLNSWRDKIIAVKGNCDFDNVEDELIFDIEDKNIFLSKEIKSGELRVES